MAAFLSTARDDTFWKRVHWVRRVIEPLADLAIWIGGCDCHEPERLAKKQVECPWQGCRACGFGERVEAALEALWGVAS